MAGSQIGPDAIHDRGDGIVTALRLGFFLWLMMDSRVVLSLSPGGATVSSPG